MTNSDRTGVSRRVMMGGLAAGAAAAGTAARAQQAGAGAPPPLAPQRFEPHNPTAQYPQPPFPRQSQDWPGLQQAMNPKPDCGETSYEGTGRLLGRQVLITGGDSGIGRAAAIAFAREGADVAFNFVEEERPDAEEVVELIEQAGRKAVPLPGDLRDQSFCRSLVDRAREQLGGLNILVNNAAYQQWVPDIADLSVEQFDRTMKTNLYAMFWLSKFAWPHMPPGSAIINTASVQAFDPSVGLLDYAMTKSAIVAFTKALAQQAADKGIRVNAVAPGPFWTPLQVAGGVPISMVEFFGSTTPYERPGQPVELAPLYVTLASAASSYVSGQVWGASGAMGHTT